MELRKSVDTLIDKTDLTITEKTNRLESAINDAEKLLPMIREAAAKSGVSKQALYFRNEASIHQKSAKCSLICIMLSALAIIALIGFITYFRNEEFLKARDSYDAAQMILSKLLTFGVLTYLLIFFSRNYMSHKHNEVVNRHRENALKTFRALVESAGGSEDKRDIVLTHAAACIFAPQETGYAKTSNASDGSPMKIIEVAQKAAPHSN